jgi:hypothetical protein
MPEQDEWSGVRSLVELKPELMLGLYDIYIICLSSHHYRMTSESLSNIVGQQRQPVREKGFF